MENVDALVVTYNRVNKLKECISNLLEMNLRKIIIVNNCSTDQTEHYLNELKASSSKIIVYNLKKNIGGAGGFNYGLKRFIKLSNDGYVWVMDDDTVPNRNALDRTLDAFSKIDLDHRGFAAGKVLWTDGNLARMNKPVFSSSEKSDNYLCAASFVGIMISRIAIQKVGYPISDFFIWGDDIEYTHRITSAGLKGIYVTDAIIIHKMNSNSDTNIIKENNDVERIKRHYFDFRNRMYISRKKGWGAFLKTIIGRCIWAFKIMFKKNKFKLLKLKVLSKGTIEGLFFNPKIEKVNIDE